PLRDRELTLHRSSSGKCTLLSLPCCLATQLQVYGDLFTIAKHGLHHYRLTALHTSKLFGDISKLGGRCANTDTHSG
ncbi:hypothetical protein B0H11DRAFT_2286845, partial [Mycena galericulata]